MVSVKHLFGFIGLFVFLVAGFSCSSGPAKTGPEDPLPSWNDGLTKQAIMDFVMDVTNPGGADFVAVPDRIAVFDNDGNLWSEQPIYFQFFFAIDRVKAMAADHPRWRTTQPFQSILENDMETLAGFGEHGILEVMMATHAGNTAEEFETLVKQWLSTARHPDSTDPIQTLSTSPCWN